MAFLSTKQKIKRFADMIEAMPNTGEFVVVFDQGEVYNLAGERILSFGVTLFDKVQAVPQYEDFDSALEAIEPAPPIENNQSNNIQEKH